MKLRSRIARQHGVFSACEDVPVLCLHGVTQTQKIVPVVVRGELYVSGSAMAGLMLRDQFADVRFPVRPSLYRMVDLGHSDRLERDLTGCLDDGPQRVPQSHKECIES